MDTSKEYITMCEKAEEIQGIELNIDMGDYFCSKEDKKIEILDEPYNNTKFPEDFIENLIWLPRQDQLQEMVIGNGNKFKNHIHALNFFIDFQYDEEFDEKKEDYIIKYASMEQLWFAFVMKEKYNKVWGGEDWTIQKTKERK